MDQLIPAIKWCQVQTVFKVVIFLSRANANALALILAPMSVLVLKRGVSALLTHCYLKAVESNCATDQVKPGLKSMVHSKGTLSKYKHTNMQKIF